MSILAGGESVTKSKYEPYITCQQQSVKLSWGNCRLPYVRAYVHGPVCISIAQSPSSGCRVHVSNAGPRGTGGESSPSRENERRKMCSVSLGCHSRGREPPYSVDTHMEADISGWFLASCVTCTVSVTRAGNRLLWQQPVFALHNWQPLGQH